MSLSLAEQVRGAVDRLPRVRVPQTPGTQARPLLPAIERLDDAAVLRADRRLSWLVTIVIGLVAFGIRLVNLSEPASLVFDETYYAKDAWALLNFGYEVNWPEDANDQIVAGTTTGWESGAAFVVHPQLGKWLIAIGIHLFGMNSFGWRISAVVFGTLLIMATVRMARRLSRSTLIGAVAGLLLTVDGLTFVMSRIALLDIFQAAFTVLAVACLVADRDWFRHRLADHLRRNGLPDLGGSYGPLLIWRPWRWTAGIGFGLAIACKWNSVYVLAALGIAVVVYDISSRRTAGARGKAFRALFIDAPIAFVSLVVSALVVYVASWWSWLRTSGGWGRDFGVRNPDDFWVRYLGEGLGSLVHYHKEMFGFHTGDWIANQTHVYESHPFQWLVMGRTIGIHAENDIASGVDGCPAAAGETCVRIISGMGTPLLWWLVFAAILVGLALWWLGRDWRFGLPLVAGLTPWLAWLPNAERPLFFFYAIVIIPFTATVLAMVLGLVLGPADAGRRRRRGAIVVGTIVVAIVVNFWFIYPVLTAQLMTRDAWELRMWFGSWI